MPQNVTVSSMLTGSRVLSDCVGNPFVTDAELVDRLDRAGKELHGRLVDRLEAKYQYSYYDLTTAASTEAYALPSDFYKLYGVDMWPASGTAGTFVSLRPYDFRRRDRRQLDSDFDPRFGASVPAYNLRGGSLYLTPAPTTARGVRVHYAPTMVSLTGSLQSFDGIEGWDDLLVCSAARFALVKQEKSTAAVDRMLEEARARVESDCQFRDAGEPEATDGGWGDWGW